MSNTPQYPSVPGMPPGGAVQASQLPQQQPAPPQQPQFPGAPTAAMPTVPVAQVPAVPQMPQPGPLAMMPQTAMAAAEQQLAMDPAMQAAVYDTPQPQQGQVFGAPPQSYVPGQADPNYDPASWQGQPQTPVPGYNVGDTAQVPPQQPGYVQEVAYPQYAPQPQTQATQVPYAAPPQQPYPAAPTGAPMAERQLPQQQQFQTPPGAPMQPQQFAAMPQAAPVHRPPAGAGWSAAQGVMDSTSSFANTLKPGPHPTVFLFMQDQPYLSFARHWIERMVPNEQSGRYEKQTRTHTCLAHRQQQCPLCQIGDKPQATSCFNCAVLADDGSVTVKSFEVGPQLFNQLRDWGADPKMGPLTRSWYQVTKAAAKGSRVQIMPLAAQTVVEQYRMQMPTQEAMASLVPYDASMLDYTSYDKLMEIAAEMMAGAEG